MTALYTTNGQAAADARALGVLGYSGRIEITLLMAVEAVALNPAASSDTLLINADALRTIAEPWRGQDKGRALHQLADALAAIAPTRVDRWR
jgi:hypothetical protein